MFVKIIFSFFMHLLVHILTVDCVCWRLSTYLVCFYSNPGVDAVPAFLNRIVLHLLVVKRGLFNQVLPRVHHSQSITAL